LMFRLPEGGVRRPLLLPGECGGSRSQSPVDEGRPHVEPKNRPPVVAAPGMAAAGPAPVRGKTLPEGRPGPGGNRMGADPDDPGGLPILPELPGFEEKVDAAGGDEPPYSRVVQPIRSAYTLGQGLQNAVQPVGVCPAGHGAIPPCGPVWV